MRKLIIFLISILVCGCSKEDTIVLDNLETPVTNIRESEVFVYSGKQLLAKRANTIWKKTNEVGYDIPNEDGTYDVWFYLRIDGNIPGESDFSMVSDQYFPQTSSGKTVIDNLNHGTVNSNVEWRNSTIKKFPKYIWGTDGSAVESIIKQKPNVNDLIALAIDSNRNIDLSGYLANSDQLHVIWYTCKQQTNDHIWHIDGILTTKDKTDISQTVYGEEQIEKYKDLVTDKGDVNRKGQVEIDIHQQEHQGWNEIKTSIHLRDTVEVEVDLPLAYAELSDDFAIRSGLDYNYITERKEVDFVIDETIYKFEVSIVHNEFGIKIYVHPNKEALIAARRKYDDGITFEIHNYVSSLVPYETIWNHLKKSTVTTLPYTTVKGQITSAYYKEEVSLTK